MKAIVATFASHVVAVAACIEVKRALQLRPEAVSLAVVSAYGEDHDGHDLLVAWVGDEQEVSASRLLTTMGGVLRPQPV